MVDYPNEEELDVILLLDTLTSESPAITYEQYQKLYKEVAQDYKGENVLKDSPLIIIVPFQLINDIDELNIGQKINVKMNASRLKFNAKQIQVVGEIVD